MTGPASAAQGKPGPFGWVLIDSIGDQVLPSVRTRAEALESVRRWDERYPNRAGRYSVARLIPDEAP